jgi:hypothetical protein
VEFCRDTTIQDLIVVAGVALVFTLISFSAGPVLIAYIVLIYIQRLTHDIRTAIVALLSTLRSFNAGPAPRHPHCSRGIALHTSIDCLAEADCNFACL